MPRSFLPALKGRPGAHGPLLRRFPSNAREPRLLVQESRLLDRSIDRKTTLCFYNPNHDPSAAEQPEKDDDEDAYFLLFFFLPFFPPFFFFESAASASRLRRAS